jgi:hypothetical protein
MRAGDTARRFVLELDFQGAQRGPERVADPDLVPPYELSRH